MSKETDPAPPGTTGHFSDEECPGALRLVSGWGGDRRHELAPGHPLHAAFAWAHARQDAWTFDEHIEFWEVHLERWPRYRRSTTTLYASALRAARARGLGDFDAAQLILARSDLPALAEPVRNRRGGEAIIPALDAQVWTGYPLPRVYDPDREPAPNPHAYPAIDQPPCDDPNVRRIQGALDALTRR